MMKAIQCLTYGPPEVLEVSEVEKPIPKADEIRVKIVAFPVTTEDPLQRTGKPYFTRLFLGLTRPNKAILGAEFAGVVEAVGKAVTLFKVGDRVFGHSGIKLGCYAEYMCMSEKGMVLKMPPGLGFNQAAPVCTTMAAWNFLKVLAKVKPKDKVLINGASGGVGSVAVQIAKQAGANVTGICSTPNLDRVLAIGADHVIDYTKTNFTEQSQTYDIVFDVSGKSSFYKAKQTLTSEGKYLCTVLKPKVIFQMYWTRFFSKKKVYFSATGMQSFKKRMSYFKALAKLFNDQCLQVYIDKTFELDDIQAAHHYVEHQKKSGNVVVTINA